MSRGHENGNTMSRRGNDEIRGELPVTKPLKAYEFGAIQEITSERGAFVEEADGMSRLSASAKVGARHQGRCVGRGGHRGREGACNRGRGQRGRECRVLNLPKQGALQILSLLMESEVLMVPKGQLDVLGGDMEGLHLAAGGKLA